MKKGVTVAVVVLFLIIVFLMLGPLWVLQEGEQAVLLQFGRIVASHQDAGLKLKTPVIDRVVKVPQEDPVLGRRRAAHPHRGEPVHLGGHHRALAHC